MERNKKPPDSEENAARALPEKGGLVQSYPELEPVFEKMGITSEDDKATVIAYVTELFQIAFEHVMSQRND